MPANREGNFGVDMNEKCEWVFDKQEGYWSNGCMNFVSGEDINPYTSGFKFCPYCGKEIEVKE